MTGPFADRLFRIAFALAGIYNLAFGLWAGFRPLAFFQLFVIAPPRYPDIWACLGMVVGVYGLLYLYAAWKLEAGWPIIAVGILGKVLGPIGMVMSFSDDWPRRLGMICIYNDLIWWLPFGLFLIRGTRIGRQLAALAPWLCVIAHIAALMMLAAFLHQGMPAETDTIERAQYVATHGMAWSIGWALWMAAAASLIGFYAWWGGCLNEATGEPHASKIPRRRAAWATLAVLIAALGMVCDFSGEGSAILRLVEHVPTVAANDSVDAWNEGVFTHVERDFALLSAGAANGMYAVAGVLLTLISPNLPRWVHGAMWLTWLAAAIMTVAAIANNVSGMIAATGMLFPLLLVWVAWMGARWRPS